MQRSKWAARQRRGAIMVMAALLMTVMAGMIAFAVDVGRITLAREQLQMAADAGAIAGADSLVNGPTTAISTATTFAQSNTAGSAAIQVGTWNSATLTFTALTGAAQSSANAVQVTCSMTQAQGDALTLFFAPIFGKQSVDITAQSVAVAKGSICGPFLGLNSASFSGAYTDSYNSSQGAYSQSSAGSSGNVCSNGTITLSGASVIHGNAHPGIGDTVNAGGGSYATGSTSPLTQALSEPAVNAGNAATVNNNANVPRSQFFNEQVVDNNGNFNLFLDVVNLPPGTYYFSSFNVEFFASVNITGPTIIYCTGNINIMDGSINANGSNLPVNCQIYGLGTCSQVSLSSGSTLYGVIYAPSANVTSSGGSIYGMAVGSSLSVSGGACHYDQSLSSLTGAQQSAQIVQ